MSRLVTSLRTVMQGEDAVSFGWSGDSSSRARTRWSALWAARPNHVASIRA